VVHTDLLDAQLYVLDKNEVSNLLEQKRHMTSLQLDVIPALVRRQFAPAVGSSRESKVRPPILRTAPTQTPTMEA
jgi:translation initiation factor eIF-2B subunit gamma